MDKLKVAYSGVEGAFAHIAARRIFPDAELVSHKDFESAYQSVEKSKCDYAVLPIENSFAGEVNQVIDLTFKGRLHIVDIYPLKINQNLLGVKGSTLADIKTVLSHAQALDQCEPFIKAHKFEPIEASNTARAAKQVAKENDKTKAAIASLETAELYGLTVLQENINENKQNTTRFAVFSREPVQSIDETKKSKCILLFTVKNESGALVKAVNVISALGYNMVSLHSRPMKDLPWQYYFYVEIEGNAMGEKGRVMLDCLSYHCDRLKVAGHYYEEDDGHNSNVQTMPD